MTNALLGCAFVWAVTGLLGMVIHIWRKDHEHRHWSDWAIDLFPGSVLAALLGPITLYWAARQKTDAEV